MYELVQVKGHDAEDVESLVLLEVVLLLDIFDERDVPLNLIFCRAPLCDEVKCSFYSGRKRVLFASQALGKDLALLYGEITVEQGQCLSRLDRIEAHGTGAVGVGHAKCDSIGGWSGWTKSY